MVLQILLTTNPAELIEVILNDEDNASIQIQNGYLYAFNVNPIPVALHNHIELSLTEKEFIRIPLAELTAMSVKRENI